MLERFTDRARRVVRLAEEEARMLSHNWIGTEHILLGLIREGDGVAAKALESLGISLDAVRQQVEEIIGRGQQVPPEAISFTPRAKKVLELSLHESVRLRHNYIGTEHILLGLIREGDGVAAQVLVAQGADLNRLRQQVLRVLHGHPAEGPVPVRFAAQQLRVMPTVQTRLEAVEQRLAAIEQRLGIGPDTSDLDEQIARVRRDSTCMTRSISFSRPITGSSLPSRAPWVRFRPNWSSTRDVEGADSDGAPDAAGSLPW